MPDANEGIGERRLSSSSLEGLVSDEVLREHVRRAIEQVKSEQQKGVLIGRLVKSPLSGVVLGFVLTTLVGGALTNKYTAKLNEQSRQAQAGLAKKDQDFQKHLAEQGQSFAENLAKLNRDWQKASEANALAHASRNAEIQRQWEQFIQSRELEASRRAQEAEFSQAQRLKATEQREVQRVAATQVFDEVSRLMDKRLYRWRRLYWALENKESPEEVEKYRINHRDAMYQWNEALNRNRALICRYFGYNAAVRFEVDISRKFIRITDMIGPCVKAYPKSPENAFLLGSSGSLAEDLHRSIYRFNNELVDVIKLGESFEDPTNRCADLVKDMDSRETIISFD